MKWDLEKKKNRLLFFCGCTREECGKGELLWRPGVLEYDMHLGGFRSICYPKGKKETWENELPYTFAEILRNYLSGTLRPTFLVARKKRCEN